MNFLPKKRKTYAEKVADKFIPVTESGCWLWTGNTNNRGYGQLHPPGESNRTVLAHRVMYELERGPIPAGLELDHLCRVTCCVNPAHLEPVTRSVNHVRGLSNTVHAALQRAKTHCPSGHEYSGDNLYLFKGYRACKTCRRKAALRWYYKNVG
jgi:hypothetical protein